MYSWGIRQVLQSLYLGDPDVRIQSTRRSKNDYYQHIMNSVFCLDIPGWATWTPRLQVRLQLHPVGFCWCFYLVHLIEFQGFEIDAV